jgi:TetR/AcrR family transcriptional repressor of nem operon
MSASPQTSHPKAMSHKETLLRQGMKSFYANGFHGTTVDAILEAAGVPKGSFYHHFRSKDAFGLAVLERYMHLQLEMLTRWSDDDTLTTAGQLTRYFDELSEIFVRSGFQRACLAGKFSTELAAGSESFRDQLAGSIEVWHAALTAVLRRGQGRGDIRTDRRAEELSHSVLAIIQGAFVIALSLRDSDALAAAGASIALLIEPAVR